MKLINFKLNNEIKLGVKTDEGILHLEKAGFSHSIHEVIEKGEKGLETLKLTVEKNKSNQSLYIDESTVEYASAVTNPEKIICVGLNYIDHAEESKMEVPTSPVIFSKHNNALAAHNEKIKLPHVAKEFDYEAELVAIIGKETSNVSVEEALSHVFGYSIGNDLSARELQFVSGQWLIGKSLDKFGPIGPYIVPAEDIDCNNLDIKCLVNGDVRQSANTKDMIFNCAEIISYVSQYMTLQPGDVIFTGTPDGVVLGYPEDKKDWLKSGDEVEVLIENIGSLKNTLY